MTRSLQIAVCSGMLALFTGELSVAIESAKYTVALHDGLLELRDYPTAVVAVVAVDGTRSGAVNSGFRLLADYIFGNNHPKSEISMTAPVTQTSPSGRPITPIPTPVADAHTWTIRFMMPAGYTLQSLPTPNDPRVHFEQAPARRIAAIRFSGFWSDANLQTHQNQLQRWMQLQHLTPKSAPTYAYYDPPWKPWFLRRIEVLIEVDSTL